jgi:Fe-S cluster assembly protein SufB
MDKKNLQSALESADRIEYEIFLNELSVDTVKRISAEQQEPGWMLDHRLKSLQLFHEMKMPSRGPDLSALNFDEIVYFAKPKQ